MAAASVADASAGVLAFTAQPAGGTRALGPGLAPGMNDAEVFERLNAWGIARDGELLDLRANLAQTQTVVAATFEQARDTLLSSVVDFRTEADTMRQHSLYEATQNLSRLEQVVTEARHRFDAQGARFAQDVGELDRRQQAVETFVRAAPAPTMLPQVLPQVVTSPGGTSHTFYPGGPAGGVQQPPAPTTSGYTTPPQRPAQHDAWGPWAAGRGVSPQGQPSQRQQPQFDAWAGAARAAQQQPPPQQQQPGESRHSFPGSGGDGGKPREMRLDARGWAVSQPRLDVGMPVDGFQVWKDRATMFLSRERPDVRKLLGWAET